MVNVLWTMQTGFCHVNLQMGEKWQLKNARNFALKITDISMQGCSMLSSAFVAVMHPEGLHFNLNVQPHVLETAPKCVVLTLEWISTKTKVICDPIQITVSLNTVVQVCRWVRLCWQSQNFMFLWPSRFRDPHFCLYFGPGCQLSPSKAQAQNTSKNNYLENCLGKLFKINSRINYLHILVTKTWSPGSANIVWLIYKLGPLCEQRSERHSIKLLFLGH